MQTNPIKGYYHQLIIGGMILLMVSCAKDNGIDQPEASCTDGLQNGMETAVDCGGNCPACPVDIVIPGGGFESPMAYDGYQLIWSDEFNGNELDVSRWSYHNGDGCPNLCFWGNNELQFYTDDAKNNWLYNGFLIITALPEQISGYQYSSSRIHTDNKFEFKYGRVDIRAAMPSATGTWVALWLLNKNYSIQNPGVYWPSGGEIDIMEFLGEDQREIYGTAHFGTDFPNNHRYNAQQYRTSQHPFDKAFYVFSIIWEEDKIQWLVNDKVYHEITPETTFAAGQPYPFNDDFFVLLNLSVGGNFPVDPIMEEFPAHLIIDYIRVFQQ